MGVTINSYRRFDNTLIYPPCVSMIVVFLVRNIDTIIFYMFFGWLQGIGWLDPSHRQKIKTRTLKYSLSQVKMSCQYMLILTNLHSRHMPIFARMVTGDTILCTLFRRQKNWLQRRSLYVVGITFAIGSLLSFYCKIFCYIKYRWH